ncbi:hypothetical protein BO78DRAFT_68353 [Aspergillus sclerotiicarbonarius CBS 121057]|uniref:Uncharacterized protein n=1 Tax=Aspergillus sclerotiicarbonarius (strain CBS 121057 / IBT 28362) TaxID=1448318 RepID=A0A319F2K7_ASPSB|nr:hypothetical protein BO78DRAFT_68353 [Aspergillus sclerotiicarbonarius CBS 121057]
MNDMLGVFGAFWYLFGKYSSCNLGTVSTVKALVGPLPLLLLFLPISSLTGFPHSLVTLCRTNSSTMQGSTLKIVFLELTYSPSKAHMPC